MSKNASVILTKAAEMTDSALDVIRYFDFNMRGGHMRVTWRAA